MLKRMAVLVLAAAFVMSCDQAAPTEPDATFAKGSNPAVYVTDLVVDKSAALYLDDLHLTGTLHVNRLPGNAFVYVRLRIEGLSEFRDGSTVWPDVLPHEAFCTYNQYGHIASTGAGFGDKGVHQLDVTFPAGATCSYYPDPVAGDYTLVLVADVRQGAHRRDRVEYRVPLTLID